MMFWPGAKTSRHAPVLDAWPPTNTARASAVSVAPTVMAWVTRAGVKPHASMLAFPAATTKVVPAAMALRTAVSRVSLVPGRQPPYVPRSGEAGLIP
jgi:hypothetical protein